MGGQPFQVKSDELLQSEGFHVIVIDDVDTEVEQVFAVFHLRGDERADVQFQFVEYGFVHDAIAVNQMLEQSVLLYGGQVFVRNIDAACAACVGLYGVHIFGFIGSTFFSVAAKIVFSRYITSFVPEILIKKQRCHLVWEDMATLDIV